MAKSMRDAMVRNLKSFADEHLAGELDWERVKLVFDGNDEGDVVEMHFALRGRAHVVRIESSEVSPPGGRVLLDSIALGPIDLSSWEAAARVLRERRAAHDEVNHGIAS